MVSTGSGPVSFFSRFGHMSFLQLFLATLGCPLPGLHKGLESLAPWATKRFALAVSLQGIPATRIDPFFLWAPRPRAEQSSGHGAAWCNGECIWDSSGATCVKGRVRQNALEPPDVTRPLTSLAPCFKQFFRKSQAETVSEMPSPGLV